MAHIVVIGAGLAGLPTAYELRYLLPSQHQITLISNTSKFTFIPSLPWVALGLIPLAKIQLELEELVIQQGIRWLPEAVVHLNPRTQTVYTDSQSLAYDYVVIATGAELALDTVSGLGPEQGFTQSICNPHHALMANSAWQNFLQNPGPLVVGAVPGASCFGPAYEFALLADYTLRQQGLRDQVSLTFVTPEPYAGHLGIGGMANSSQLVTELMAARDVAVLENTAIDSVTSQEIILANGDAVPFQYAMLLPQFRGPGFVRETAGLGDTKGFLPILPTYQHPVFPSVFSAGVVTQLAPPEVTPIAIGVPKTGQMVEAMGMAVAHNIALALGAISDQPVTPTLEAICFADFGDTGLLFLADPVLPDPVTGRRRRAITLGGRWVGWLKTAFERYFLAKMRWGAAVPWFERLGLRAAGFSLLEAAPSTEPDSVREDVLIH
ncbi:NAD(P)/FAD-dependent oxidoreductase [Acaryochloris marina]|uniref:Sulfide-quinone reductase n=1 Tax=Acaryochloris marina (strain MBIC 11017) TaxID=329726 RepID=B0CB18_ACAM1|nr:FAD/NAD(P)-binding oxidoreductase [Acaryochloris marina]ABW25508.1 sulfide quinone reductase [Acaryochloris marina MBIC11017]BDM80392.1 sulfide:quinone reductase [Acaryochloris marina MBIC10699]